MTDRQLIEVSGPDAFHFLQGLVSNDVKGLSDGLVYAALLTPQGKYLADFFLVPLGDAIGIDIEATAADALLKRLSMYKLRADVTLAKSARSVSRGRGAVPEGAYADPRHPDLGWRGYDGQDGDATDWDAIRVDHCIPETGIELTPDTYILEAGFAALHGVDFRKGCYVGQEVTARMKHKTELRKGLKTVSIEGAAPVGTPLLTADGKEAGTLYTQSHGKAIAYLRFDRATGPMTAGDATVTL